MIIKRVNIKAGFYLCLWGFMVMNSLLGMELQGGRRCLESLQNDHAYLPCDHNANRCKRLANCLDLFCLIRLKYERKREKELYPFHPGNPFLLTH